MRASRAFHSEGSSSTSTICNPLPNPPLALAPTSALMMDTQRSNRLETDPSCRIRPLLTRDDSVIRSSPKMQRIYGRLPRFSPFLGTFQHAPSAGNRSRLSFFEHYLMTEDEHERRKRIKTNPFTGTFHFYPGRYSSLHGLQRFRNRPSFSRSFDELDRLEALGRRVSQKVREADNPSLAANFMNGIFSTVVPATYGQRASLYPHKTKNSAKFSQDLGFQVGAARYRYGGAVDVTRKYRSSLDDCALVWNASSLYRDILYRWNGFRKFYTQYFRPPMRVRYGHAEDNEIQLLRMRSRSFSTKTDRGPEGLSAITEPIAGERREDSKVFSRVASHPSLLDMLSKGTPQGNTSRPNTSLSHDIIQGHLTGHTNSKVADRGNKRESFKRQAPAHLQPQFYNGQLLQMTRVSTISTPPSTGLRTPSPIAVSNRATPHLTSTPSHRPPSASKQHLKVTDKYDIRMQEILGEGSFAAVYGASERATGVEVAVKAVKRRYLFTEDEKAALRYEIDNMRRLPSHCNLINLLETFETPEYVYLVVARSTHGNLEQILQLRRKLTELETMWVMKQVLDATEVMHDAGVLHCDIKPSNMLFSNMEGSAKGGQDQRMWMYTSPLGMVLKLCDFGLSRKVPDVKYFKHTGDIYKVPFSRICGTGGFIPPEIIGKQPFGKPADMWSIGISCYRMLSGALPFIPACKCLKRSVTFKGRVWEPISKEACDFITRLLVNDPCRRATMKETLAHPWLETVPQWAPLCNALANTPCAGGKGGLKKDSLR